MAVDTLKTFETRMLGFTASLATDIPAQIVAETQKIYSTTIRSSVYAATNGGRLRNVGKNGARVGVLSKQITPTSAIVQATGPLQLIERDTKAHLIPRITGSRRLRTAAGRLSHKREATGTVVSGNKILVINGNVVTGPVPHPGTRGKHPFELGVAAVGNAGLEASHVVFERAVASVFGG